MKRTAIAWSGGKDCAWALRNFKSATHLITTFDGSTGKVPIHNVGIEKVQQQADALRMRLILVELPPACPNSIYIERFRVACRDFASVVFGDLFLADIRAFREASFPDLDLQFPLWKRDTTELAKEMIGGGLVATVTAAKDADLVGRAYDLAFLSELPPQIDPCGENGEFHTWVEPKCLESFR